MVILDFAAIGLVARPTKKRPMIKDGDLRIVMSFHGHEIGSFDLIKNSRLFRLEANAIPVNIFIVPSGTYGLVEICKG